MKTTPKDGPNHQPQGGHAPAQQPEVPHICPSHGFHKAGTVQPTAPIGGDQPATDHLPACVPVTSRGGNSVIKSEPGAEGPLTAALKDRAFFYTHDPAIAATAARLGEIGADYLLNRAIDVLANPDLHGGQDVKQLARSFLRSSPADELEAWEVEDIMKVNALSQTEP